MLSKTDGGKQQKILVKGQLDSNKFVETLCPRFYFTPLILLLSCTLVLLLETTTTTTTTSQDLSSALLPIQTKL